MHFVTFAAMFSKALLLLAVCFQVLRTGNSMDDVRQLRCPWQIGESVNININVYEYRSHAAPDCKVWFKDEQDEKGDIGDLLLVSILSRIARTGHSNTLVINTKVNGKWQSEDRTNLGTLRYPLIEDVVAEEKGFKIKIQGKEYFRDYEFPLENIKHIKVECPYENIFKVDETWSKE